MKHVVFYFYLILCLSLLVLLQNSVQAQTTVLMNNSTDNTSETGCSYTIYDSGGDGTNYQNDENYTLTICSGTSDLIQLNFVEFVTESSYDYLYVYDGADDSAPQVNGSPFSGSTAPEAITSTGTCITIRFTSDGTNTDTGFQISTSCVAPPANEECANAVNLPCGTSDMAGTTIATSAQVHGTGCSISEYGVWYTFTGDGGETTISSTADFDHKMAISSGTCGSLTHIDCVDESITGTETFTFTPANGTDYFIYLAHYSSSSTETGDFTISRSACLTDMSFVSCTASQPNTSGVSNGSENQEILCIQIETDGELNPLEVSEIVVRTDGTDAFSTDVSNVNLWYTGTNSSFTSSNHFGTTQAPVASGNDLTFSDNQSLQSGTNYFWLTYDIPTGATIGNSLDAILQKITINGITETPVLSNPAGNREIIAGCYYTLRLEDTFGDGWDDARLSIEVDGLTVLSDLTCSNDFTEYEFIAETGDDISCVYTPGDYPEENSYVVINPNGAYIGSSGEAGSIPQNISTNANCDAVKKFTMNGDTYQNGDACFILTEDKEEQAGSVWSNYKIDLSDDFTIDFDIYLGDKSGGADGIVFALQGDCASSGGDGSSLGFGGIAKSVGIEFDTYENGSNGDLINDHIAIISDGSTDHWGATNLAGPYDAGELEDDAWHAASISWDASTEQLSVSLDGSQVLSYTGDIITDQLNANTQVFWGFTGGTGSFSNLQKVCVNSYPQNTTELVDMTICSGCTVDVEASSGANSYSWTPDDGSISNTAVYNPTLSPDITTEYTLTIEDGCGNFLTNKFTVYVGLLPVELTGFNANCEANYVDILWNTASETNSSHFILEHSDDMLNWNQLAEISAAGNTNTGRDYRFRDNSYDKVRYYRLTQVDFDGNSRVYDVIAVNCAAQEKEISVYPNPCEDKLYVNLHNYADALSIDCLDAAGKLVLSKRLTNIEQTFFIDIQNLPASVYTLVIYNETILKRVQIIKL